MMTFITAPLIVGIVTLGIYKLFELFAHKRERLAMIEKLNDKLIDFSSLEKFPLSQLTNNKFSYGALKAGCLLMGVGLGLLIGFLISMNYFPLCDTKMQDNWHVEQASSIVYGSCVLLFGGAGLILAFVIEMRNSKNKKDDK